MNNDLKDNIFPHNIIYGQNIESLVEKANLYPYCSLLHFQILKEYKNNDSHLYDSHLQKIAIYSPNLLKLNWLLRDNTYDSVIAETSIEEDNKINDLPLESLQLNQQEEKSTPVNSDNSFQYEPVKENETFIQPQVVSDSFKSAENLFKTVDKAEAKLKAEQQFAIKEEVLPTDNPVISTETIESSAVINNLTEDKVTKTQENINSEELTFEPLYTKDYFASQGIKLNEEIAPNDKLGNQMKSFTQWLKSMKKINTEKPMEPDEVVDKRIQNIAEVSNTTEDVVTESMANVLLIQGKHAKAIEMYEKLSLINPSKSAYFAAIIQVLKLR